jgi:hypothetical protein
VAYSTNGGRRGTRIDCLRESQREGGMYLVEVAWGDVDWIGAGGEFL